MAKIDNRGIVDDGTNGLTVDGAVNMNGAVNLAGTLTVIGNISAANVVSVGVGISVPGVVSSSNAAYTELKTLDNNLVGQNLGTANTWTRIGQWLTASAQTTQVYPTPLALTASITTDMPGMYFTNANMSFSGTNGVYTFGLFYAGASTPTAQSSLNISGTNGSVLWPAHVAISNYSKQGSSDTIDVRVKSNVASAIFQMNNGTFIAFHTES